MLFFTNKSNAAFIIKDIKIRKECHSSYINPIEKIINLKQYQLNNHDRFIHHRQNKKKWVATLLSFPCFGLCLLGIHRFYLGFVVQGLAQLLSFILGFAIVLFAIEIGFTSTLIVVAYFIGLFLLFGALIWEFIDFFRICSGYLKPKYGDYEKPNIDR